MPNETLWHPAAPAYSRSRRTTMAGPSRRRFPRLPAAARRAGACGLAGLARRCPSGPYPAAMTLGRARGEERSRCCPVEPDFRGVRQGRLAALAGRNGQVTVPRPLIGKRRCAPGRSRRRPGRPLCPAYPARRRVTRAAARSAGAERVDRRGHAVPRGPRQAPRPPAAWLIRYMVSS
jgi:hypothetical protein